MAQFNPSAAAFRQTRSGGRAASKGSPQHRRAGVKRKKSHLFEWTVVVMLLAGLGVAIWLMSGDSDPKGQASAVVNQMKAAALGKPLGPAILPNLPSALRNKHEAVVSIDKVPPKICVMVSWDLYRFGSIAINGVTPNHVSAAKLVELCNQTDTASLTWTVKLVN